MDFLSTNLHSIVLVVLRAAVAEKGERWYKNDSNA